MAAIFQTTHLKCIFLNENVWILIKISLKFVLNGPINYIPALVQIMAWRRVGDKPLSEPMVVDLLTYSVTFHEDVMTWMHCWSPVDSTHQRPVMKSVHISFIIRMNRLLNSRWFGTPWRPCDVTIMFPYHHPDPDLPLEGRPRYDRISQSPSQRQCRQYGTPEWQCCQSMSKCPETVRHRI